MTLDRGPVDGQRAQHERSDVIGRARQHQVGVDQLALVPHPLLVGRVRGAAARSVVPDIVNVQAPSRCGMPASQSSSRPPPANDGTSRDSSGCTGPQ